MTTAAALRGQIVAAARARLGTPWQHQQRGEYAVDCGGLVIDVARTLGLLDECTADAIAVDYARVPDGRRLLEHCNAHMHRIAVRDLQPGDVVVLQGAVHPQHLAIVGDYVHGGLSMIHAIDHPDRRRAVVTEHRLRGQVAAAYRLPGVPEA